MSGSFSYVELHTHAPAQARDFYRQLFGWKMSDEEVPGFGTYTSIEPTEGPQGGLMKAANRAQPSSWVVYMNVPDLTEATKQVRTLGGGVLNERVEIKGHGTMAVVTDPTGAVFNLWQPAA